MATQPAIEASELTKTYGEITAVNGLNLSVAEGTVYGFLGPNGAGKTTTMEMLTTLIEPTSGTAYIVGEPVTERKRVTPHIGYLPDEAPIYDELTAREQLEYAAGLRHMSTDDAHERIETLLERFDLVEAADRRTGTYSHGMRRKTGIIQAILHRPEVVFLDEPTNGLDPRAAYTVRNIIGDLAEEDMTIFLSTHILPVVDDIADTVGVLFDGRLVAEGAPTSLKRRAETGEERTLEQAFLDVTSEGDESTEEIPTER